MSESLLRVEDVVEKIGVSRTTLWRWSKDGSFPQRIQLGQNSSGYVASEVETWIQDRMDAR